MPDFLKPSRGLPTNKSELYEAGISAKYLDQHLQRPPGLLGISPSNPNYCPYNIGGDIEISISNAMLAHFEGLGFSLKTLCLAITSPMGYNVESGAPIPTVNLAGHKWVLLNAPDCFKRGTPLLDCRLKYHWFWRDPIGDQKYQAAALELDRFIQQALRDHKALPRFIDSDKLTRLAGSALAEELFQGNPSGGIEFVEVSNAFPRGYAYRLTTGFMAGDDPEEERREEGASGKQILTLADMKAAVPWGR